MLGRGERGGYEMVLELEAISKEETALCAFCDLLWWRPCLYCRAAFVWFLLLLYLHLFATVIHLVLNLVFYLGLYDQHDLHEFDSGLLFRGTFLCTLWFSTSIRFVSGFDCWHSFSFPCVLLPWFVLMVIDLFDALWTLFLFKYLIRLVSIVLKLILLLRKYSITNHLLILIFALRFELLWHVIHVILSAKVWILLCLLFTTQNATNLTRWIYFAYISR